MRGRKPNAPKTQFAENLRALRLREHLLPVEAARRMGITLDSLYLYERGDSGVRADTLAILADFYGVSMDDLWRGDLGWIGENYLE